MKFFKTCDKEIKNIKREISGNLAWKEIVLFLASILKYNLQTCKLTKHAFLTNLNSSAYDVLLHNVKNCAKLI